MSTHKKIVAYFLALMLILQSKPLLSLDFHIISKEERETKRQEEIEELQRHFDWWPTDALPAPVKDEKHDGYWWWPTQPGRARPWGNRGYVYVYKIIFDYKEEELPAPKPQEPRPSLLIKKTIRNTKIFFDYDRADLRDDHIPILEDATKSLKRNPETDILITGNCDRRGSEAYNLELGKRRADVVKQYMVDKNIPDKRIRIISRGKLDALAPLTDLVGMQKDRNTHFVVAEVEEVMIPHPGEAERLGAIPFKEAKYIIEKDEYIESEVKVATRQYVIKRNDTLKKIAQEQLGGSHRWRYLYEFNKGRIKNPDALEAGTSIMIPIEQEEQKKILVYEDKPEAIRSKTPPPEELAVFNTRSYTVRKNDSLWNIAQQQLGNGNRWKEIYELNKNKIKNPDKLVPGIKIIIPAEQKENQKDVLFE